MSWGWLGAPFSTRGSALPNPPTPCPFREASLGQCPFQCTSNFPQKNWWSPFFRKCIFQKQKCLPKRWKYFLLDVRLKEVCRRYSRVARTGHQHAGLVLGTCQYVHMWQSRPGAVASENAQSLGHFDAFLGVARRYRRVTGRIYQTLPAEEGCHPCFFFTWFQAISAYFATKKAKSRPFPHLSVYLSAHLSTYLSIYPSICLSIYEMQSLSKLLTLDLGTAHAPWSR